MHKGVRFHFEGTLNRQDLRRIPALLIRMWTVPKALTAWSTMGFPSVTLPAAATAWPPAAYDEDTCLAKVDQGTSVMATLTLLDLVDDLLGSLN
jgi:hypothetical protein